MSNECIYSSFFISHFLQCELSKKCWKTGTFNFYYDNYMEKISSLKITLKVLKVNEIGSNGSLILCYIQSISKKVYLTNNSTG